MNNEAIENYLNNGMTEAERTAFEQEMAADPNLAKTVALYREIEATMSNAHTAEAGIPALQQQLEALGKQHFGKTGAANNDAPVVAIKNKRRYFYWAGAAAAAVLAVVLVRPLLQTQQVDLEKLYANNAKYNILGSTDRSSGKYDAQAKASQLMEKGDYPAALKILDSLAVTDSSTDITLAKAACYTETNDSARANQVFTAVQAQKDKYLATATWYKALLYLKYKDIASCRATLLTMPKDNVLSDDVAKLLKNLPQP